MSQKTSQSDTDQLRKRLQEVISREFHELGRGVIAGALVELARDYTVGYEADSEQDLEGDHDLDLSSAGEWKGGASQSLARPSTAEGHEMDSHAVASVTIEATAPELVASLLYQTLQVGAVLVTLAEPPALNAMVSVTLSFPDAHLRLQTRGRVVHVSPRGAAIEVSGIDREDRAALQTLYDDYLRYAAPQGSANLPSPEAESGPDARRDSPHRAPPSDVAPQGPDPGDSNNGYMDTAGISASGDEHLRSFASFSSRKGVVGGTHHGMTARRRVELPLPDEVVMTSTAKARALTSTTREFYGPEQVWLSPDSDPERVETLADERIIDILLQLSEAGFTGIMEYAGAKGARQLYFDGGYLVDMRVNPRLAEEELGPMLQAADRISKRQLAMAAAHADEFELTLERSLLELEILNTEMIRHTIAGRLSYLLGEFLELREGQVSIFSGHTLPAGFLPSPPLRVHVATERCVYDRFFRHLAQLSATKRELIIGGELDAYPEIVSQERDRLERAVTDDEQWRLLERVIVGRRRLREVFTESGLPSAETFAVIYALHRMGLLRFDHSLHHTIVRERMRENVTVKYLSVHKASFFEVLNVHWSSYDEAVEKAYLDLIKQFDPGSVPGEMEPEVHERVGEIRERIESAYAALAQRADRHAYRMRIMPEYKLAHAIPLFMKQSELAERRNQWSEARDAIRRVLEIDPEHSEAKRRLQQIDVRLHGKPEATTNEKK